jgi:hypothetical protein
MTTEGASVVGSLEVLEDRLCPETDEGLMEEEPRSETLRLELLNLL